jgi:hypothetical protein
MMYHVVFLSNVSPGPACTIPEDKKIFRVNSEETAAIPFDGLSPTADCSEEAANENLPLPVPHMYSA